MVRSRFFLLLESLERFTDPEKLLTFVLELLSFLQEVFALSSQDGTLHVTESADDLGLEILQLLFEIRLQRKE